jgi:phage-related minor tail protein
MAGTDKLLGTLTLNAEKVYKTIEKVNRDLKNLGKGVDLDLTNLLNAQVTNRLQTLERQLDK